MDIRAMVLVTNGVKAKEAQERSLRLRVEKGEPKGEELALLKKYLASQLQFAMGGKVK